MSISMSGATVDNSERDTLLANEIDGSVASGGVEANTSGGWFFGLGGEESGAKLAGVTASFATNVSGAIDDYISGVQGCIDNITSADYKVGFQGAGVGDALNTFIESVKTVATTYINQLKDAEQLIITSVGEAYADQDSDLSSNMSTDAGTLEGDNSF